MLNWRDLKNGTALDSSYIPDELDKTPVSACAVGMIYAFYGRLSVSMNNVETLRNANLPPAFYCWGTRDGFAGQFTQNANAVEQAGCRVVRKILQNYPHGYGTGGNHDVWGHDFDIFLTEIMSGNASVEDITASRTYDADSTIVYNLQGQPVETNSGSHGIFIIKESGKVLKKRI